MRTILYLLLLLSFVGCQKEDYSPEGQLRGIWLFKEGKYGTGGGVKIIKPDPAHPVRLVFKKDGTFSIDPQLRLSSLIYRLQEFDHYQLLPDNQIRFYNTTNNQEFICDIELDKELRINQIGCREGCADFFIKSY